MFLALRPEGRETGIRSGYNSMVIARWPCSIGVLRSPRSTASFRSRMRWGGPQVRPLKCQTKSLPAQPESAVPVALRRGTVQRDGHRFQGNTGRGWRLSRRRFFSRSLILPDNLRRQRHPQHRPQRLPLLQLPSKTRSPQSALRFQKAQQHFSFPAAVPRSRRPWVVRLRETPSKSRTLSTTTPLPS